jgi:hypothetical protein
MTLEPLGEHVKKKTGTGLMIPGWNPIRISYYRGHPSRRYP